MQKIRQLDHFKPGAENGYMAKHVDLLIASYYHWTGKALIKPKHSGEDKYLAIYKAPFAIVSHNTEDDPIFNYANQTALHLFEMNWSEFTSLPSRKSAEPVNRSEREKLMAQVTNKGFINDYQGVRISSSGKRFKIKDATVWNIIDNTGNYCGQAAVFHKWYEV